MKQTNNNASNPYKVGDVLYISWGYSMTIVAFFKVTRVTASKVGLVELAQEADYDGYLSGHTLPKIEEEMEADGTPFSVYPDALYSVRKDGWNAVRIPDYKGGHDYTNAYKWEGKPVYFNHCD